MVEIREHTLAERHILMHSTNFRPDIEGLRAIAILFVVFFHADLPVSGGYVGVDVFFVISGFLITGLLLRQMERTGTISFVDFYGRRAKRLLPASFLTLAVMSVAVLLWALESEQLDFGTDIAAAAGYVANWRFAAQSTDYLAEGSARSPAIHFWSLAVEEQFYMIWPLLLLGATRLARRRSWNLRLCSAVVLACVVVPSFMWSIVYTQNHPTEAFFATTTRLWELGCGAYLALSASWVRDLPRQWGLVLGGVGWGLLVASLFLFDAKTEWPGVAALVPVLGASFLITSGTVAPQNPTLRPLSLRPMVALGGLSYSWYLWHWPVLVVGSDFFHLSGAGAELALVLLSLLPAWISYRYVERPFRASVRLDAAPGQSVSLGLALTLAGILLGLAVRFQIDTDEMGADAVQLVVEDDEVRARPTHWGAGALGDDPRQSEAGHASASQGTLVPPPKLATKDVPTAYPRKCQMEYGVTKISWCETGDARGKVDAVMVGDSKILQYFDALDAIGDALGWRIRAATKSACPFSAASVSYNGRPYKDCDEVNKMLLKEFELRPPDLILTSQTSSSGKLGEGDSTGSVDDMVRGLVSHWSKLEHAGTDVVVVLDNPHPPQSVYKCVLQHANEHAKCAFSREKGIRESAAPAQLAAEKVLPAVDIVDLRDYICPQAECAPAIGGVLVYRQGSHLTNTYAKTLAPQLHHQLAAFDFEG